jgi:hypothetical protein
MNNHRAMIIADHLAALPGRSGQAIIQAARVVWGNQHRSPKEAAYFHRSLTASAAPLIPDIEAIRFADIDVEVNQLGRSLSGTAYYVTDSAIICLTFSAETGATPAHTVGSVESAAVIRRRADIVQAKLTRVDAPDFDDMEAQWTPENPVLTLTMRSGDTIELRSTAGEEAEFIALCGNLLH